MTYNCERKGVNMKTVLITGASRGIGEDIARKFAKNGYNVVVNYFRSEQKAQKLAEELCLYGVQAVAIRADVGDPVQAKLLVKKSLEIFGSIDVLVNNAGIALNKLLIDCSTTEIENIILTNLLGTIYTTKEVLPNMMSNMNGKIINISSMWGTVGGSMESVYSASKGGVIAFTKAIAKEVGLCGINVNCVCPGVIVTDMTSNLTIDDMNDLKDQTALGRVGYPNDISGLVYFLATDDASYITGSVINADGGII